MSNTDAMQRASAKLVEQSNQPFSTQSPDTVDATQPLPEDKRRGDEKLSEYEANAPATPS